MDDVSPDFGQTPGSGFPESLDAEQWLVPTEPLVFGFSVDRAIRREIGPIFWVWEATIWCELVRGRLSRSFSGRWFTI